VASESSVSLWAEIKILSTAHSSIIPPSSLTVAKSGAVTAFTWNYFFFFAAFFLAFFAGFFFAAFFFLAIIIHLPSVKKDSFE